VSPGARKGLVITAIVALAIVVGAGVYLTQVLVPRTMEGLGSAISTMVDSALGQSDRLSAPEQVPAGSRIWLERRSVGEVTIRFHIAQNPSGHPVAGPHLTGLLALFEIPDSTTVFGGQLTDARAGVTIRADTALVALLSPDAKPGAPLMIHIVPRADVIGAPAAGYLWLPGDSLTLPIVRRYP
jgi:hypothetical protein